MEQAALVREDIDLDLDQVHSGRQLALSHSYGNGSWHISQSSNAWAIALQTYKAEQRTRLALIANLNNTVAKLDTVLQTPFLASRLIHLARDGLCSTLPLGCISVRSAVKEVITAFAKPELTILHNADPTTLQTMSTSFDRAEFELDYAAAWIDLAEAVVSLQSGLVSAVQSRRTRIESCTKASRRAGASPRTTVEYRSKKRQTGKGRGGEETLGNLLLRSIETVRDSGVQEWAAEVVWNLRTMAWMMEEKGVDVRSIALSPIPSLGPFRDGSHRFFIA